MYGDFAEADKAMTQAWSSIRQARSLAAFHRWPRAEVALACGKLITARRLADNIVASTAGWHLVSALTIRARIAIAQSEPRQAEGDLHEAIGITATTQAYLAVIRSRLELGERSAAAHHGRTRGPLLCAGRYSRAISTIDSIATHVASTRPVFNR
jgi:hypothetical protein